MIIMIMNIRFEAYLEQSHNKYLSKRFAYFIQIMAYGFDWRYLVTSSDFNQK